MNFPRYWAVGRHDGYVCWRWSNVSLPDAEAAAGAAARKLAERFASGDPPRERYGYADRPMREQILREMPSADGGLAAVITRNAYGCLVLNTARVLFVDIDIPQLEEGSGFAFFRKLFGKPSAEQLLTNAHERIDRWTQANPGFGWRIYRTRAGLRLIATHDVFEPGVVLANGIFEALGADPLYRRLCQNQKCFRARLTPKPWRCDIAKPPCRWPWMDTTAESRYDKWDKLYTAKIATKATCELIRTVGSYEIHPEVQTLLSIHDELTRAESKLPLA